MAERRSECLVYQEETQTLEPKIVRREAFAVMGVVGHFASAAEDFGPLWDEYMGHHDAIAALSVDEGHYGVYLGADHTVPIDYMAGMAVAAVTRAPAGVTVLEVPPALYAVFACSFRAIGQTYGHIWDEWLRSSAYEQDRSAHGFDYFPPGTTDGDSPIEIWFPVKTRSDEPSRVARLDVRSDGE